MDAFIDQYFLVIILGIFAAAGIGLIVGILAFTNSESFHRAVEKEMLRSYQPGGIITAEQMNKGIDGSFLN